MPTHSDPSKPAGRRAGQLEELLSQGQAAVHAGQRSEARRLFHQVLALDPDNVDAWIWLAYLAPSPRQSVAYLEQARALHPHSQRLREALAWAQSRLDPASLPGMAPAQAARRPVSPPRRTSPRQQHAGPQSPLPERPVPAVEELPSQRLARLAAKPRPQALPPRAMARPQGEGRPALRTAPFVFGTALVTLALLVLGASYLLQGWTPAPSATATPTVALAPTPMVDMGSLREQAGAAIGRQAWEEAIPLLEKMRQLSPDDDGVRQQLAVAHLRFGLQLVDLDRIDEAIAHYDAAIRFYANDVDLQTARRLAIGYRDGRQAVTDGRWDEAVELLEPVYQIAPGFRDAADLLFTVHLERAKKLESAQQLVAARDAYARAAALKPDSKEAQAKLAEITLILTPPTPTPIPRPRKRIEVSVSQQRLRAYENDALVFNWVCSTGGVATPTRFGTFQVLDKIPEAWSSVWALRMPYWLGIYWAGGSENGIHALPIFRSGQVLWAGNLGHRISYGCIVLDTPNAARLYRWAEIGTPVIVRP